MARILWYLKALLNSLTLQWQSRNITSATLYVSFPWGGGADAYLNKNVGSEEGFAIIVRAIGGFHLLDVEIFENGKRRRRSTIMGLCTLLGLKGRIKRIVINQLVLWSLYEREVRVSNRIVDKLISKLLFLRRALSSDLIYLVHDYYSICPRWTLTADDNMYCNSEFTSAKCHKCLRVGSESYMTVGGIDIKSWRSSFERLLIAADEVRTFSNDSRKRISRIFPRANVTVVPHKVLSVLRKPKLSKFGVTIGVVGMSSPVKGCKRVEMLKDYLSECGSLWKVRVVTDYQRDELPDIIEREGINVAFFSSVWPETFSYVTQELMEMDIPIVCFNLGAPAERVRSYAKGCVAKDFRPESVVEAINCLSRRGVLNA